MPRLIEENENEKAMENGIERLRSHSRANTIRIFLVDDSNVFIRVASQFLSLPPKYEIVGSSTSGELAIDQIRNLKPDLVIIDLVMPGMNGMEAARLVKKMALSPRVILISFQENPEYRSTAKAVGADGFLTKTDFGDKVIPTIDELFFGSKSAQENNYVAI